MPCWTNSSWQHNLNQLASGKRGTVHADVCTLFDEFDAVLSEGALELPNEFVRWGIDPQFDADAVARYAEAIAGGADAVEALVDRLSHEWELHVNMDY